MQESQLEINRPERDQTKVQKGFGLNTSNDQGFCGLPHIGGTGVCHSRGSNGVADGLRPGVFHPRQSESREEMATFFSGTIVVASASLSVVLPGMVKKRMK